MRRRPRAARKCSNQTNLRLTLADLFYRSNLLERPSPTSVSLVCIQKATALRTRREPRGHVPLLADPLREIHTHR